MNLNLDIAYTAVLGLLLLLSCILFKETKDLQTQINELRIIVDQKFLPAMILDERQLNDCP